jgi:hypothetical protein
MMGAREVTRMSPSLGAATAAEERSLVTFEVRHPDPNVLVVTNLWPHEEDPAYGIFVKRQVDSLHDLGVRADVLFIRGYISTAAYARAALVLGKLNRSGPAYDLVHVHGGEAVLSAVAYRRAPVLASYLGDDLLGTRNGDGTFPLPRRARRAVLRRSAWFVQHTITKSREMELALPSGWRRQRVSRPPPSSARFSSRPSAASTPARCRSS